MKSDLTEKELGMVRLGLQQFNTEVLPALRAMKEKVDRGETLNDEETAQLDDAIERSKRSAVFAEKHPDYKALVDSAIEIYDYIATKSAENAAKNS